MNNRRYDYSNMYYPYMPYDKKKGLYYDYPNTTVQMPYEDYEGTDEMDLEYMKRMYPELARQIQYYIDEECDKMEYDGSYMYDEYPDKEVIHLLVEKLYEMIKSDPSITIEEMNTEDNEQVEGQQYGYGNPWGRFGLRDLIQVMLLNEIFGRRRRYYRRRRPRRPSPMPYYPNYYKY